MRFSSRGAPCGCPYMIWTIGPRGGRKTRGDHKGRPYEKNGIDEICFSSIMHIYAKRWQEGSMRPKKTRWVTCAPGERCFRPQCEPSREIEGVVLTLDEFETMMLTHLKGYGQKRISRQMKIHQSTISRILKSAHRKVTDALVHLKAIKVEGGCCQRIRNKKRRTS